VGFCISFNGEKIVTEKQPIPDDNFNQKTTRGSLRVLERAMRWWVHTHKHGPELLRSLGIDHPDLSWHNAIKYRRESRTKALAEVSEGLIKILILEKARQNWIATNPVTFAPSREDFADAVMWAKRTFIRNKETNNE
jgi:hypothetical protein